MKQNKILNFEFNLKTKAKIGPGQALSLGKYLSELNVKKIGVIIDSAVFNLPYTKEILENVKKENFERIKIWEYNLKFEPDYDSLDRVKKEFLDKDLKPLVDCFAGIGGGSVIDFAKGLATVLVNPGDAINYRGFPTGINPPLPTIALPTTLGTGSEVTYNAVFIDFKNKKKLGINTMSNFPALAILDPNLTLSCPRPVIVSSGMDALTHTLESYVATKANQLTKSLAREAFQLIFNSLAKVSTKPGDIGIRMNLMLGSYLAGASLMNSGSGPAGALSYPLGVHFKVPHGFGGAIFLPHIVESNAKKGYDYSELYDLIEKSDKSLSRKEKSRIFSRELFKLCKKLGVPLSLKDVGINQHNADILLKEAENFEKAFAQNSIPFSVKEGKKLIIKLTK